MKFSYRQYSIVPSPIINSDVLYRPMVPLRVIGPSGDAFLWAIVDTGADQTILPRSIGESMNVTIDDSKTAPVAGYGGHHVAVAPGTVDLLLSSNGQTFRWSATIGFVAFDNPEQEVSLLGHAACLDYFRVTFDGEAHELELVPTPQFPGTVS